MALSDHKITDAAIAEKGVVAAPDQLSGSARTNKMLFDRLIREAVKEDYNGLIDALMAATGAGEIGAAVDGLSGATIQAILNSVKTALDSKISSAVTEAALELKSDKDVTNKHIKSVELDEATGTFTFTRENGTKIVIDTALEKVAVNFTYDEDSQSLLLTLADGSTETVSLAAFVTTTEFDDSSTIEWSVSGSKVKATVKEGSITDTMLSGALKSMLLSYINRAASSATAAKASEDAAAGSATSAGGSASAAASSAGKAANYNSGAKSAADRAEKSAGRASSSERNASTYASSAQESIKHAPRISSSGKWELWDATQGAYVATEYTAIGKDGTRWWTYAYLVANMSGNLLIDKRYLPAAVVGDYVLGTKNDSGVVYTITGETESGDSWVVKRECILKGAAGTDGTTPHIGDNGNWYIGETDTGVSAGGASYIFKVEVVTGPDPDGLSADKTFAEIRSAYASGSMVVVRQSTVLYYLTYMSDVKAEFTYTDETYCYVLSCANYGAPSEVDIWQLNRTKRLNYDTKYRDIGLKTVPVAIKELQDKSAPAVTDADTGKYLHVNASTKELEWAGLSFTDDGDGNISVDGATAQSVNRFLQSLTFPGLNFKYINPLNSGTYSNPYGVYVGSGASLVDTILTKTVPGVYTVYMNRNATDVPAAAAAASSSLRGLVVLSQIKKHYAIILLVDQLSNFYVQYIQDDVGGGWKQMPTSAGGSDLPAVTAADAGKFLRVSSSGSWVAETVANANGGEF